MIRNLKALGLALMAVFAMSAITASGAAAQKGELTSDGSFYLVGTELAEGNELKYPGLPGTTCKESHFKAGVVGETPHAALENGATVFTVVPTYTNCKVGIFPATVDMTGCDYKFTLGETTGEPSANTYGVDATLECENTGEEEPHLTAYSDTGHTNPICEITFTHEGLVSTLHATDTTDGTIRIHGTVHSIHAKKRLGGCGGEGTTNEAVYHVNVEVTGENEGGGQTDVAISHSE